MEIKDRQNGESEHGAALRWRVICPLITRHRAMNTHRITEKELIDNAESGAIRRFCMVKDDGRYGIQVELTWKPGWQTLITQRGRDKRWASLDRLVRHIEAKYPRVRTLELQLRE
ncbi:hypothetical protein P8631_11390 (plasmid) [Guyparkeria sp. 1SP6A2]|nr:hypothetical protein [Guyparkeria sp. 1SP6A2]